MSALSLALTIFGIMLALMAIRVPIAVAMFGAGTVGYVMQVAGEHFPASSTRKPLPALPAMTCQ